MIDKWIYKFFGALDKLINEIHNMFQTISYCSCCDTHLENCPKTITDTWNRYPLQRIDHYPQVKTCLCPCRAYKRQLVRAYINE